MPNPFYRYILNVISKHILLITFLNEPEQISLHTVKWFHLILTYTNNCITINHGFVHSVMFSSILMYHSQSN